MFEGIHEGRGVVVTSGSQGIGQGRAQRAELRVDGGLLARIAAALPARD